MENRTVERITTPAYSRCLALCLYLAIAGAFLTVVLGAADHFVGPQPFFGVWEDSLMLPRYAHNLLTSGLISWNPGGPATYGLTCPYYFLLIVVPVARFVTTNPIGMAVASSSLSGVLFFITLALVLPRVLPGPRRYRRVFYIFLAFAFARSASDLVMHLISGMDTYFGMLYLTLYIALFAWHSRSRTILSAILTGILGGLAFGARPDLLLFAIILPATSLVGEFQTGQRRLGFLTLAATGIVLVSQVIAALTYFHSPLPLPFYAKALHPYAGLTGFGITSFHYLLDYLLSYWLLFLLIAAGLALDVRRWWNKSEPLERGLLIATVLHIAYFLLAVTQIMPRGARFYYPTLPAIIYLAGMAAIRLLHAADSFWTRLANLIPARYLYFAAALTLLTFPPQVGGFLKVQRIAKGDIASFDLAKEYRTYLSDYWFALDKFSSLPSDLTLATTEVGHPAALDLHRQIIDLAGLNDPLFTHHRFSADLLFQHYRPDLIYMPHPGYRGMNQELEQNAVFKRDYEWIPSDRLGTTMGIALLRASPYYLAMRHVVDTSSPQQ